MEEERGLSIIAGHIGFKWHSVSKMAMFKKPQGLVTFAPDLRWGYEQCLDCKLLPVDDLRRHVGLLG